MTISIGESCQPTEFHSFASSCDCSAHPEHKGADTVLGPVSELDPVVAAVVRQLRDAILDADVTLLQTVNKRMQLAARLSAYRSAHGLPATDDSDDWTLGYLQGANGGPLSREGLEDLHRALRALR
jgi:chorismate mutase